MDPILLTSVYYVHPSTDLRFGSTLNMAFVHYFSNFFSTKTVDLCSILSLLNGKNTIEAFANLLPNMQAEYALDIIVWLLRCEIIADTIIWSAFS